MATGTYIPSANVPILGQTNDIKSGVGNINLHSSNTLYSKNNIVVGTDHIVNGNNNVVNGTGHNVLGTNHTVSGMSHSVSGNNIHIVGGDTFVASNDNSLNILTDVIYKEKSFVAGDVGLTGGFTSLFKVIEKDYFTSFDDFMLAYNVGTGSSATVIQLDNYIEYKTKDINKGGANIYREIDFKLGLFTTNLATSAPTDIILIWDTAGTWPGVPRGSYNVYLDIIGSGTASSGKFSNVQSVWSVNYNSSSVLRTQTLSFNHQEANTTTTPDLSVSAVVGGGSPTKFTIGWGGTGYNIDNMNWNMVVKIIWTPAD